MFVEQKKKPNYTKEQFILFVKEFCNEQKEFKEKHERFNTIKQLFYNDAEELFNYEGIDKLVIDKSYTITDINRLIIYLKSCDVDPKAFKSFINVTKTVDEKKLDKLADLGLIRKE